MHDSINRGLPIHGSHIDIHNKPLLVDIFQRVAYFVLNALLSQVRAIHEGFGAIENALYQNPLA